MKEKVSLLLLFTICMCLGLSSCNKEDEDGSIPSDFCGTYTGSDVVSNGHRRYVTLVFYENGTGTHKFESPSGSSFHSFTYRFSGNSIICRGEGYFVENDGTTEKQDFNKTMKYKSPNTIIYNTYTLTKN